MSAAASDRPSISDTGDDRREMELAGRQCAGRLPGVPMSDLSAVLATLEPIATDICELINRKVAAPFMSSAFCPWPIIGPYWGKIWLSER